MDQKNIGLAFCGDILISRRFPNRYSESLLEISEILRQQDCRFGNLETTVHNRRGYPEMFSGGSYTMASPFCLKDLADFGFNVFNTANNHSMDYGHGGLLATLRHLDELGIPHCGTGRNLSDASAPAYVECQGGRVAFIGVTSSFHDSYAAGPQNQDLQGRPGVNPLRHKAIYELENKHFDSLKEIANMIGINSYHDQARKEGYLPEIEDFKFGCYNFRRGEKASVQTSPDTNDLKRTINTILDARYTSDIVVVSIHSHQFMGLDKHNTPQFIRTFAHKCIDAGADFIVCHGPHVMRGIEYYGNGVIFHGLGNFILQHESMAVVAEEQYWKVGTTRQNSTGVGDAINLRSKGGKRGLSADPDSWISYFVTIDWTPSAKSIRIHPIIIDKEKNNGLPSLTNDNNILAKIKELNSVYNH